MKKFTFKTILLLVLFIAVMKYIDVRDYVVYDKKDGSTKVEDVRNKDRENLNKISEKIK